MQIGLFLALILAITKPIGVFMARVFGGERTFLDPVLRPIERLLYRVTGVDEKHEMRWTEYAFTMLLFSGASMLLLYLMERVQQWLPWNPQKFEQSARHWLLTPRVLYNEHELQNYSGEVTMSYLTQMAAWPTTTSRRRRLASHWRSRSFAASPAPKKKPSKFLGRYDPLHAVGAAAGLHRLRPAPGFAGSRAKSQTLRHREAGRIATGPEDWNDGKPMVTPDGKPVMDTVTDQTIAQGRLLRKRRSRC